MTALLLVAGALVALGAGVATGARGARAASVGALVCLVFAPFVAEPLSDIPVALFRIVAGVLAAFLLLVAGRRAGDESGSPLGLPATLAAAAAAFAAGLGATAVGLPAFGPGAAVGAGLACLAVALPPVIRGRDAFRLGTALVVLANAGLLLRSGLSGTPAALEVLVGGAALVGLAAVVVMLASTAATATGDLAIPGDAIERRRPPA
ncbi:MAG TPA: hypothetical protein VER83_00805 [Candidatus Nanopelagicales bacterium]|nr:hypothetical protein [Candidatus Nanopelagicales bacterium]